MINDLVEKSNQEKKAKRAERFRMLEDLDYNNTHDIQNIMDSQP